MEAVRRETTKELLIAPSMDVLR